MTATLDAPPVVPGWFTDPWEDLDAEFAALAPLVPEGEPFNAPMFGVQRPQYFTCPRWVTSAGPEAIGLAAETGLFLDPWEAWFLIHALGENAAGRWASFAVKLTVSRQNGKGAILEARELAGLFLFGEELLVHSAHRFNTCQLAYQRMLTRIEQAPRLARKVARTPAAHGEEAIELFPTPTIISGPGAKQVSLSRTPTLRYLARSKSAARGFTGDFVGLDEDMILDAADCAAMIPSISARGQLTDAGPQVWYMGSAGIGRESSQAARVRRAGHRGGTRLCYGEWAVELHDEYCPRGCDNPRHLDPTAAATIAAANPGYGLRLEHELAIDELDQLGIVPWAQERLGVGTWPAAEDGWAVLAERLWDSRRVPDSTPRPRSPVFSIDVAPQRASAAISACGLLSDGRRGVEVCDHRRGSYWCVDAACELDAKFGPAVWVVDPRTDAGSLITDLIARGLRVEQMRAMDVAQAFGMFVDAVRADELAHYGDPDMRRGMAGADTRKLSDGLAWDRAGAAVDITTVVSATNAHWGHKKFGGGADYDIGDSVGFDVTEVIRYYTMGTYTAADLVRLAAAGIIRAADLGRIEAAGIPIPAGLVARD